MSKRAFVRIFFAEWNRYVHVANRRKNPSVNLDIVSKHRGPIYGLSIIWIVVFHGRAIDGVDYSFGISALVPLKNVIATGNVGVDMFLFLSGVCLYFSFVKDSDIGHFMKKRFLRIVPAVWLVNTLYWMVRYLFLSFNPAGFLSRMSLMRFWMTGDSSIWFVSLIVVLYLLYPLIHRFLFPPQGGRSWVRCLMLLAIAYALILLLYYCNKDLYEMVEIALTRVPIFIFGCWMGKLVYERRQLSRPWVLVPVALCILFAIVMQFNLLHGPWRRFFYAIGGVSLSYCVALLCCVFARFGESSSRPLYRFLSWTGGFSLELYLSHIMLNQVLRLQPFYQEGNLAQYAAMATIAFVMAWVVSKIVAAIQHVVQNRRAGTVVS